MEEVDIIELRQFYRAGIEVTEKNKGKFDENPLKSSKKHQKFTEFFINGKSLSKTISEFHKLSEPLTLNWVGALGFHFTKEIEAIKVNRLLLRPTSELQLVESFPQKLDKKHLKRYIRDFKTELANEEVLIYVCGECGDCSCGGIAIKISQNDDYYLWTYQSDDEEDISKEIILMFKFDKKQYLETFEAHLASR